MWVRVNQSKPGSGFVLAVLVAKVFFENASFGARAEELQRKNDEEKQKEIGIPEKEEQADQEERGENVNGVADARVDPVRDQLPGLRRKGEGVAELDAGHRQRDQRGDHEEEAGDAMRVPRRMPVFVDDQSDHSNGKENEEFWAAVHRHGAR
jgi:hypothetical protein